MTKGQIAGQIFIYIMAVIIIGGIVLIGYSSISKIFPKVCDTEKITFKSEIESSLEKYTSYGSVNKKIMAAPCDYQTICFVDYQEISNPAGFSCANTIINDSVNSKVMENIFVISGVRTTGISYSEFISLPNPNNCTCIIVRNNNFYITFAGKGATTEITASQ